jgi:hypothetical protein
MLCQVVDSPEILSVIDSIPHLSAFLNSLYASKYGDFMKVRLLVLLLFFLLSLFVSRPGSNRSPRCL